MPLFLGLHGSFLSDINRHNRGPSSLRLDARGWHVDTEPPSLPGGECYPRVHGAAARGRPTVLGVYSLRKSCASDGYPPPQLRQRFRFQLLRVETERRPVRDSGWSGGRCLPESVLRILWVDIELGKNILQCIDESIFLPTSNIY